jgi:hypothetical protein
MHAHNIFQGTATSWLRQGETTLNHSMVMLVFAVQLNQLLAQLLPAKGLRLGLN